MRTDILYWNQMRVVLASRWDKAPLSYMIYSTLFMPQYREAGAVFQSPLFCNKLFGIYCTIRSLNQNDQKDSQVFFKGNQMVQNSLVRKEKKNNFWKTSILEFWMKFQSIVLAHLCWCCTEDHLFTYAVKILKVCTWVKQQTFLL